MAEAVTTRDRAKINVDVLGSGPAVLLVPGQSYGIDSWLNFRGALAERFTVVSYDHRGIGGSELGDLQLEHTTRTYADDAIAILDALAIPRAHIVGFSMGGRICQWLAIDHADRVDRAVLIATSPGDRHGIPRDAEADEVVRTRPRDRFRDMMLHPEWVAQHPRQANLLCAEPPPEALALHYRASQSHDAWERLPSIAARTLVVHGSADRINPPGNAELLAQRIPGAKLRLIDGARHCCYAEYPPTAELTAAFLRY